MISVTFLSDGSYPPNIYCLGSLLKQDTHLSLRPTQQTLPNGLGYPQSLQTILPYMGYNIFHLALPVSNRLKYILAQKRVRFSFFPATLLPCLPVEQQTDNPLSLLCHSGT